MMNDAVHRSASSNKEIETIRTRLINKNPGYFSGQEYYSSSPWKARDGRYEHGVIGLHNEIKDFFNYIKPTPEEQFAREIVVSKITDVAHSLWPDCQVDVFGSFKTGLYLPTSDIDMVIFGRWEALPLHTLKQALSRSGISSEIKVLDKTTVPIVKMTDKETELKVDISFNMINSVRAAELIRKYMRTYPCLPHLVFVLKQFLLQRNLNEVWTGGLSSYALILMVVRFLQTRMSVYPDRSNLGTLLLEFFELYGRLFNYLHTAIRVTDGGQYVRKEVVQQNMEHGLQPSILCIEDPLCPGNDVGRRSYCALQVKQAFEHAYVALSYRVLPQYHSLHDRADITCLAEIIHMSEQSLDARQRIRDFASRMQEIIKPQNLLPVNSESQHANPNDMVQLNNTQSNVTTGLWPSAGLSYLFAPGLSLLVPGPLALGNVKTTALSAAAIPSWPIAANQSLVVPIPFVSQLVSPADDSNIPSHSTTATTQITLPATAAMVSAENVPKSATVNSASKTSSETAGVLDTSAQDRNSLPAITDLEHRRDIKPAECSVLAEELASLSTSKDGSSGSDRSVCPSFQINPQCHQDCKRRCLRADSPIESQSSHPSSVTVSSQPPDSAICSMTYPTAGGINVKVTYSNEPPMSNAPSIRTRKSTAPAQKAHHPNSPLPSNNSSSRDIGSTGRSVRFVGTQASATDAACMTIGTVFAASASVPKRHSAGSRRSNK